MRLGPLLVFAPSLEEARRFYGEVLGFSLAGESSDMLLFRQPDFELAIFRCDQATSPEGYARVAGTSITFSVPSLETAMEELRAKGVRFLHSTPAGGPLGRYAAFIDPFGAVHELLERPKV